MAENSQELKLWFDKDVKPYVIGENPELDKIIDELTNKLVEEINNGKFDKKDNTDTSEN